MSTARSTWKKFESRVAAFFSCKRAVLSGSANREDKGRSDSTHETLFLEAKLRERHAVRTLHDATQALAKREGKLPVLALADKGRPGFLLVIHSDNWEQVVAEWAAGLEGDELASLEGRIRRAWNRRRGFADPSL